MLQANRILVKVDPAVWIIYRQYIPAVISKYGSIFLVQQELESESKLQSKYLAVYDVQLQA